MQRPLRAYFVSQAREWISQVHPDKGDFMERAGA